MGSPDSSQPKTPRLESGQKKMFHQKHFLATYQSPPSKSKAIRPSGNNSHLEPHDVASFNANAMVIGRTANLVPVISKMKKMQNKFDIHMN